MPIRRRAPVHFQGLLSDNQLMSVVERRKFHRDRVDVPANLYLDGTDGARRPCRIVSLGGGGCALEIDTAETITDDLLHELRFSLPNRPEPVVFDCRLVDTLAYPGGDKQRLHLSFWQPRPGFQDSVINYVQNHKHLDKSGYKVSMPVWLDPLRGSRAETAMGMTVEAGRTHAVVDCNRSTPTLGATVRATFLAPRIIHETSVNAEIEEMTRTMRGFRVRLAFEEPTEQVVEFVRRHYGAKSRPAALAR
jgi:hypothetical protein